MAANLAASLAALGAPSSQQGQGNTGPGAPKLPPKKRHRPDGANSVSAGPVRVGESLLRSTAEGESRAYHAASLGTGLVPAARLTLLLARRTARHLRSRSASSRRRMPEKHAATALRALR